MYVSVENLSVLNVIVFGSVSKSDKISAFPPRTRIISKSDPNAPNSSEMSAVNVNSLFVSVIGVLDRPSISLFRSRLQQQPISLPSGNICSAAAISSALSALSTSLPEKINFTLYPFSIEALSSSVNSACKVSFEASTESISLPSLLFTSQSTSPGSAAASILRIEAFKVPPTKPDTFAVIVIPVSSFVTVTPLSHWYSESPVPSR